MVKKVRQNGKTGERDGWGELLIGAHTQILGSLLFTCNNIT